MDIQQVDALIQRTAALEKELAAKDRELEIEAALEKVRARAMAMKSSVELAEAAQALYNELRALGIQPVTCGYAFVNEESQSQTVWVTLPDGTLLPDSILFPLMGEVILNDRYQSWRNKEPLHKAVIEGEINKTHHEFLAPHVPPDIVKNIFALVPKNIVFYSANFSAGYLMIIAGEALKKEEEEIVIRFTKVFEITYTRFFDLQRAEAQVREAKIEAALERVRSRSMGMYKSEEVMDVAVKVYEELQKLDFKFGAATIIIMDKETGYMEHWLAGFFQKNHVESYQVNNIHHPLHATQLAAWRKGEKFVSIEMSGPALKSYAEEMFTQSGYKNLPEEEKSLLLSNENAVFNLAYMSHGALMWAPSSLTHEKIKILQRFAKVFEQTYTRFLDLQKAEAQAREAQIELALERVRARTMAMQHSKDLTDTANLLFQQVQALGVPSWSCGFNIWEEKEKCFTAWMSSEGILQPPFKIPLSEVRTFNRFYESRQKGEVFYVEEMGGDTLKIQYEYMKGLPGFGEILNNFLKSGFTLPNFQINHVVNFKQGNLIFITSVPVTQAYDIFKRFAKVFEQTYTRFNDLKQAEAQAREAKIEAALERVRSRSMAMHHSDELDNVVKTLGDELVHLGISLDGALILLFEKDKRNFHLRIATNHLPAPLKVNMPYQEDIQENEIIKNLWEAIETGGDFINKSYSGKVKNDYFRFVDKHNASTIPEEVRKFHLDAESWTFSFVGGKNSVVGIDNWSRKVTTPDGFKVLKRFANVFEQAYTRFQDLQKAEAQAREARIEATMERLRSKAMGMQTSQELSNIIHTMYQELKKLDESLNRCFIMIFDDQTRGVTWWMAGDDVLPTDLAYYIPYSEHPPQMAYLRGWKEQREKWQYTIEGKEKRDWDEFLFHETELAKLPAIVSGYMKSFDKIYLEASFKSFGCLTTGSVHPISEEAFDILIRFTKVFDLTYTRFNDLKQAEQLSAKAEQDLVLLKQEKQRTEDALKELKATQAQLIQKEKMASLGELTAGIAHEIQNPLNFVNNFSEVSNEMMEEMNAELEKGDIEEAKAISADIKQNLEKIHHHGKRADAIVKGMLQHSRATSGKKEPTNINTLCDEYLRLSYHGLRAKDKDFNATFKTDFDQSAGRINVVPQDIGRVLLNLYNNAFFAVHEKKRLNNDSFEPLVTVTTINENGSVIITVSDNGNGIPEVIKEKIFQPFFTTKPTGQGTGLGLSLSYDIIKAHGGEIRVESSGKIGSRFIIHLPIK